jgi:hypothetical protein
MPAEPVRTDTPVESLAEQFKAEGFLRFERFIAPETLAELRDIYDRMLDGEIDCGINDRKLGEVTRQIMEPSAYHPTFRINEATRVGMRLAKALLDVERPRIAFSMLIYKEPGQTAETPWHQDFAYAQMPFTAAGSNIPYDESVQFWVPLDDVDEDNGCMHFLPGGHLDPLHQHFVAGGAPDDPGRLLAIRDPERTLDLSKAVACPLPAGGATVHSFGTPHFTGGNRTSDRRRRAYIFNISRKGLESLVGAPSAA